ncbi:hypothetical protein BC351_06070 [Paenibacillus ferrarius]|uniref:Uncharacterized protein n=1 Tax=Paenibacillus ferrarius TaxID=1469647 RepID=A0A1V4HGV5_9BACL|nr:hypothetical protein BC351_06070 [Paenibacillus ferrarius]
MHNCRFRESNWSWSQRKQEAHQEIIRTRNSYSEIDPDAIVIRMKEDHTQNSQFMSGYHVQIRAAGNRKVKVSLE